jgi:hypothetical protein
MQGRKKIMKRCISILALLNIIIALSIAGSVCAGDKEETPADKIKQAQEGLITLDYYKGEASGTMNKETGDAIREFQKKDMKMMIPTGILDTKTADMINKKADKKKSKDKEGSKSGIDKAKEKMDESKSKVEGEGDKLKTGLDVVK